MPANRVAAAELAVREADLTRLKTGLRPEEIAQTEVRLQRLQALITRQQRDVQDSMVGKTVSVLFEKPGRFAGQMVGKSEYLHAVHVQDSGAAIGDLRQVRIKASGSNSLAGEILVAG